MADDTQISRIKWPKTIVFEKRSKVEAGAPHTIRVFERLLQSRWTSSRTSLEDSVVTIRAPLKIDPLPFLQSS